MYGAGFRPCELYNIAAAKSMGKRELILVVAFVVVGFCMYQLTAAPAQPGARSVSVRGILDHLRREIRGNRSRAETERTTTYPIDATVSEARLRLGSSVQLTVVGEDRQDVEIHLRVRSNGYDDAEAQSLAKQSVDALKIDNAGEALIATVSYPEPGTQWPTAVVKVPKRLRVRVEQASALNVADVHAVELGPTRGDTAIKNIATLVTGTHRGGNKLSIERAVGVKMTTRGSQVAVADVKDLTLSMNGGELAASDVKGAIEIDSNQGDVKLSKIDKAAGPIRVHVSSGTVTIDGLVSDTRIDGRNSEITVIFLRPTTVAIYNEGDEDVRIVPPPAGGFKIDAVARDGRITPPEMLTELGVEHSATDDGKEARASGAVRGGGPTMTLRANHGNIVFAPRHEPTEHTPTSNPATPAPPTPPKPPTPKAPIPK